jgi:hypothetical protein
VVQHRQSVLQIDGDTALGGGRPIVVAHHKLEAVRLAGRRSWLVGVADVAAAAGRAGEPARDAPDQLTLGHIQIEDTVETDGHRRR